MNAKKQFQFILMNLRNNIGVMSFALLIALFVFPILFFDRMVEPTLHVTPIPTLKEFFKGLQLKSVVMYFFAIIPALTLFSYLFKRTGTDFFHSLAIKRSKLLFLNFVSGCLLFLIPLAIGYVVLAVRCIPVMQQVQIDHFFVMLFLSFIFTVAMLVLVFTMFTFCATYAGNIISTFVVFLTVFALPLVSLLSSKMLLHRFVFGYVPIKESIDFACVDNNLTAQEVLTATFIVLILSAILYMLTNRSYQNRKSEEAAKMLSNAWMKNLFLFNALFIATTFTLFIVDGPTYLAAIVVAIVTLVVATAIVEEGFKQVFKIKSFVKFASFLAFMCAILLVLWSSEMGNTEVPASSDVMAVTVGDVYGDLNVSYSPATEERLLMDPATIEAVTQMHEGVVTESAYPVGSGSDFENKIEITYYMKNGDTLMYTYNLDDIPSSVMSDFVNTQENKENMFFFLEKGYTLDGIMFDDYSETLASTTANINQEEIIEVFNDPKVLSGLAEAIQKDVMNDPEMTVRCDDPAYYKNPELVPEEVIGVIHFFGSNVAGERFSMEFVIKDSYVNTIEYVDQTLQSNLGYGLEMFQ